METLAHVATLTVIGAILGGIGAGLAWVNAMAAGLMPLRWPPRPLPLMLTAPPALAWAAMCLWMLTLMAGDPTAANLWPLTVLLMAALWLVWIALAWAFAAVIRRLRRG
jgi:Ca2+/Na+ antiporter